MSVFSTLWKSRIPTDSPVRLQAVWNDTVIAESDKTILVEGTHYFPPQDVRMEYLAASDRHATETWRGEACFYDVIVEGKRNAAAAWYHPSPRPAVEKIADLIAFRHGVEIRPA